MSLGYEIEQIWKSTIKPGIETQIISRGYRVSNEMRNSVLTTLRGQGSGRIYRVPGTKKYYQASAPGEVPAVRTGIYRMSWHPKTYISGGDLVVISQIDTDYKVNGYVLGELLEFGTSKMAPRPHIEKIGKDAEQKAMKIYSAPYL